jgi:hypothetical protein
MLMVMGNNGDQVDLADGTDKAGWDNRTGSIGVFYIWNHDTSGVTVYVQSGVLVT